MYLNETVRGMGLGRKMIDYVLAAAKQKGYTQVYLETMPELNKAVKVYEQFGFSYLDGPMGNSGHNGCDIWMIRTL
jgi:putative acetyltransferase